MTVYTEIEVLMLMLVDIHAFRKIRSDLFAEAACVGVDTVAGFHDLAVPHFMSIQAQVFRRRVIQVTTQTTNKSMMHLLEVDE